MLTAKRNTNSVMEIAFFFYPQTQNLTLGYKKWCYRHTRIMRSRWVLMDHIIKNSIVSGSQRATWIPHTYSPRHRYSVVFIFTIKPHKHKLGTCSADPKRFCVHLSHIFQSCWSAMIGNCPECASKRFLHLSDRQAISLSMSNRLGEKRDHWHSLKFVWQVICSIESHVTKRLRVDLAFTNISRCCVHTLNIYKKDVNRLQPYLKTLLNTYQQLVESDWSNS